MVALASPYARAAIAICADADAFLATQGDVWDTQWDIFLCLLGAALSLLLFSRLHNRQLLQVGMPVTPPPLR